MTSVATQSFSNSYMQNRIKSKGQGPFKQIVCYLPSLVQGDIHPRYQQPYYQLVFSHSNFLSPNLGATGIFYPLKQLSPTRNIVLPNGSRKDKLFSVSLLLMILL